MHLPIDVVYGAWTRFETFPRFMLGVHDVTPLDDVTLRWQADIGGRQREWTTLIDEQTPDTHLRWHNAEQPTYTYDVSLEPVGGAPQTRVTIQLEYEDDAAESRGALRATCIASNPLSNPSIHQMLTLSKMGKRRVPASVAKAASVAKPLVQ